MERQEIYNLLIKTPIEKLKEHAQIITQKHKGEYVNCRGLIEFSNICKRNCLYCGLREQNKNLNRYSLTQDEVLAAARNAYEAGVDTIVLQSGEGAVEAEWLAEVVREIKRTLNLAITLSVGEAPVQDYILWKQAGANRYLIKHETANPLLYKFFHPGYNLRERAAALQVLKTLGYEIGTGFIIGLPGQKLESYIDDILLCQKLQINMIGIGPLIPQVDTPLTHACNGSVAETLRLLSVLRIIFPEVNLPATTALATLDPATGQKEGLLAGANVLMPNFTPHIHAKDYRIYDDKIPITIASAAKAITEAGRKHSLKV